MKIETTTVARDEYGFVCSSMETIVAMKSADYLYYFGDGRHAICFDLDFSCPTAVQITEGIDFSLPIESFIDELKARGILDENEVITDAYTEEQFCFKLCMDD